MTWLSTWISRIFSGLKGLLTRASPKANNAAAGREVAPAGEQPQDVIIALVGKAGSGKTTFLHRATGQECVNDGARLEPQTKDTVYCRAAHPLDPERYVLFIDTPGSDYIDEDGRGRSNKEILENIWNWVKENYPGRQHINAILYFHSIPAYVNQDERLGDLASMMKLLDSNMQNAILTMTMWGEIHPSEEAKAKAALISRWHRSARHCHFEDSNESAIQILRMIES